MKIAIEIESETQPGLIDALDAASRFLMEGYCTADYHEFTNRFRVRMDAESDTVERFDGLYAESRQDRPGWIDHK